MKNLVISGAVAAGLLSGPVLAAELVGGSLDIGYSQFTDDDDGARYSFTGSGELAFNRQFSLQLDLGLYNYDLINETGRTITLHSNFHVNDTTSLGVFIGQDDLGNGDAEFYGAEIGYAMPSLAIEGYLSRLDGSGSDATLLGAEVRGRLNDRFDLNAKIDHMDGDSIELTRLSLGTDYNIGEGASLYGEIGTADATAFGSSADETFVGVGLRIDFGSKRGTTFGRRGLLDKIPGL